MLWLWHLRKYTDAELQAVTEALFPCFSSFMDFHCAFCVPEKAGRLLWEIDSLWILAC